MAGSDRKCCIYIDVESTRATLEGAESTVGAFCERIAALARAHGRVTGAFAYGDIDSEEAKELKRSGIEARLTSEDGDGSTPESIAIAIEATEAAARGPFVEMMILVTDDAQLAELVRRQKRAGRFTMVVVPGAIAEQEPARSADRGVTIEAVVSGSVAVELPPEDSRPPREPHSRPRPPSGQTIDFATYDWTRLILLMRDLETKMPFVGMRWLKNKVIGPHNVGAVTIADKQLLLNRAVEEGLIETYRVGNRDEAGDPVTACKLIRTNERVTAVLAANPAPPPPVVEAAVEEVPPEAVAAGSGG
jgi:hypothetical protein